MSVFIKISYPRGEQERHVNLDWTLDEFKGRLEAITGIPAQAQQLLVSVPKGSTPVTAAGSTLLAELGLQPSSEITVKDTRPAKDQFDFDAPVDRYEMSEKDYEKRDDTVLAWKKKNGLGRFSSSGSGSGSGSGSASGSAAAGSESEPSDHLSVGQTCFAKLASGDVVKGTIGYIGDVEGIPTGTWVGVKLDRPLGKHNGTINGIPYFITLDNHGVFVRPSAVSLEDLDEL